MALQSTTALGTITLQEASSSVTFSSIPATYRDLILIADCSTTSITDILCNLNGNSSDGSYSRVRASGDGSSTYSGSTTPRAVTYYGAPTSGLKSNHVIQFLDYSATDKHKTYLSRSNRAGYGTDMIASRFASTAAITSISLVSGAVSFEAGSTFALFGRIA